MSEKRTPLSAFVKRSWTNMNIRAGKYRHHSSSKNLCYQNLYVEFTRDAYKNWCTERWSEISKLSRPSVDRIDSSKGYLLENLQIIELFNNIRKKRYGSAYVNGPKSKNVRGVRKTRTGFVARITFQKKETYLGTFNTQVEAEQAFRNEYIKFYGKEPW